MTDGSLMKVESIAECPPYENRSSKAVLPLWRIYVFFSVLFLLCFQARLFINYMSCGHLLGKG